MAILPLENYIFKISSIKFQINFVGSLFLYTFATAFEKQPVKGLMAG